MGLTPIPMSRSTVRVLTRSAALMLEASAYGDRPLPSRLRLALLRCSQAITRLLERRAPPR